MRTTLLTVIALTVLALAGCSGELVTAGQDLADFRQVRIVAASVEVQVSPARGGARLETRLDSRRRLTVRENGDELSIDVSRVRGFSTRGSEEVVRLTVPDNVRARLDAGSGSMKISGIVFADLTVDVGSGSVAVSDSEGPMTIDVGSGSIYLEKVSGRFDLTSGSGSMDGEGVTLTGNSSFDSGSGSIEMTLLNSPDDLAFDLDAGSGSIRVGDISGADRVAFGSGGIRVTGNSGSGSQEYRFR